MSTQLTPQQRERLQTIETMRQRVQHLHGLVEKFGVAGKEADAQTSALRRAIGQLKLQLLGNNFPVLAQTCAQLELSARRGTAVARLKQLRDGIGTLRFQLEAEQRVILASRAQRSVGENKD
jgi:hypothetical protein